jgi:hypothetical protein
VTTSAPSSSRRFWIGFAVGLIPMAWGVRLYLDLTPDAARRIDVVAWLVGADLVHDLLVAPLVVGVGWALTQVVPARVRPPVTVGLVLTGTVLLVGWLPLVGSAGDGNATIQPRAYGREIALVVLVIWVAVLLAVVARRHEPAN